MTDPSMPVDINSATRQELLALPRVTPALADGILMARPFTSVDDLRRVKRVGPKWLERLRPFLIIGSDQLSVNSELIEENREQVAEPMYVEEVAVQPGLATEGQPAQASANPPPENLPPVSLAPEEQPALPTINPPPIRLFQVSPVPEDAPALPPANLSPVDLPPASAPPEEPPAQPSANPQPANRLPVSAPPSSAQPKYISWSSALAMSAISGLTVLLLAVLFILGTLTVLNGGLRFARPSQLSRLENQIEALSTQAGEIQQSVSDVDTRLKVVEGLDGRVTTLEETTKQLRTDTDVNAVLLKGLDDQVSGLTLQAQNLDQKVTDLALQVDALLTRTGRFQKFMDGLRELLNGLAQP